jgi:hypothetical protein
MFPAENLRDWRGKKVLDPKSDKIGELEAVYVDTATDQPSFTKEFVSRSTPGVMR